MKDRYQETYDCARCGSDLTEDLIRRLEQGGHGWCSRCTLDLPEPSAEWLAQRGYETGEEDAS